jgi:hypothetical protein
MILVCTHCTLSYTEKEEDSTHFTWLGDLWMVTKEIVKLVVSRVFPFLSRLYTYICVCVYLSIKNITIKNVIWGQRSVIHKESKTEKYILV